MCATRVDIIPAVAEAMITAPRVVTGEEAMPVIVTVVGKMKEVIGVIAVPAAMTRIV